MSWLMPRLVVRDLPLRRGKPYTRSRPVRIPMIEELEGRKLLSVGPGHEHAGMMPSPPKMVPGTGGHYRSGLPFTDPTEYVSQNGVLSVTLHVQEQVVKVSGRRVLALVYNDSYAAPTLRLKPGDQLEIALVNDLDEMTNLHFHGLHVSPQGDSDNIFLMIEPHTTFHYVVNIPLDQPTGTYWYHSHAHPISEMQVFDGLSGTIIITGLEGLLPPDLHGITQHVFQLKDLQVQNGAIVQDNINSDAPTTRMVNGLLVPKLKIRPGETQLWRFANIGADIFYKLTMGGRKFTIIAEDGNPVWRVTSRTKLVLPPGKRYDVLVRGGHRGISQLRTHAYTTGPVGDQYPSRALVTIVTRGHSQTPAPLPIQMVPVDDLRNDPVAATRGFVFSENTQTNQFYINGEQFDPHRVDVRPVLGTTEEWVIANVTQEQHPFHIHVNDFQVISINGVPYDANGGQDTVVLPVGGYVVIRQRFTDFKGKFVFHCHILAHEDNGMMQVVEVI